MWLKIAVPGAILVILSLVFFDVAVLNSRFTGFKPFGEDKKNEVIKKETKPAQATAAANLALKTSPTPKATASATLAPSPTVKATPRPTLKAITGSITLLQDNTGSQTSASTTLPTGTGVISGTINLSGIIPSGASVVILAKPYGATNSYQTVISGLPASNNTSWQWTGAKSGSGYEMVAVLKGSSGGVDTDYAHSQAYIVTAPASNQIFSINAGTVMSAPTGAITITCTTHHSNNTWAATVNFASIVGAEAYTLQVGKTSGESDIANTRQNAQSGLNQTVSVTIDDSVQYYARYSTASVTNPTPYQYSPFSAVTPVKCP